MIRRVSQLPPAQEIPRIDELVVPIFQGNTDMALYQIPVAQLALLIREAVLDGGSIEMIETEQGIRFLREQ